MCHQKGEDTGVRVLFQAGDKVIHLLYLAPIAACVPKYFSPYPILCSEKYTTKIPCINDV